MVTFELERPPLVEALRGWRNARIVPLYAGGLIGGLAIGLGIAAVSAGSAGEVTLAPSTYAGREVGVAAVEPLPATAEAVVELYDPAPGMVVFPLSPTLKTMSDVIVEPPAAPEVAPATAPAAPAETAPAAAPPAAALPQVPQAQPVADTPPAPAPAPVEPAKPNFYVPAVSSGPLSGMEQRFFDAANKERAAAGLTPLVFDSTLTTIARTRSQQLVDQGYFGHTDPYGYSMYVELLSEFGIQWYAWAGENLAMNNYGDAESPERAMAALMNSPTHKRNVLGTEFSRLGVGLVTADDGRKYYTMIFLG